MTRTHELTDYETTHWLREFKSDGVLATLQMPNVVYASLRHQDLIRSDGTLSDRALNLIGD